MKNILYIVCIIFAILNSNAQTPIIPIENQILDDYEDVNNSYLKDVNNKFNPFFGEWKWEEGNSSFTIVFSKIEMVYGIDIYEDALIGKYKFIKDGVTIYDFLNITVTPNTFWGSNMGKMMHSSGYFSDNYIDFGIYDNGIERDLIADAEILTPILTDFNGMNIVQVGAQLRWRLRFGEGPFIDEQFSPYDYFSLPANVILIKQ